MKPTNIAAPDYFHKVVDCQWACPAHTPVPEYIRLIAAGRYSDAYMINWQSNVFPGILGRTCDRPCEPACRRVRVEDEPVAICRLKRVAADYKDDIKSPAAAKPATKNGKRIALVGAGPASLTVARDLAPLGYECVVFDGDKRAGGMIRSQIPKFRLPDSVIDEECGYILDLGVEFRGGQYIDSMKKLLGQGFDAIFVGSRRAARPRPRHSRPQGSRSQHPHRHRLARPTSRSATSTRSASASSCSAAATPPWTAAARRAASAATDVKVIVRSGFEEMKASPWEKEDAAREGIPIHNFLVPEAVPAQGRQAHRHGVREGEGRVRRQGPAQAGPCRRAGPDLRMRRRAGRGRPGECVSLDRARHRHRVRRMGHAGRQRDDLPLDHIRRSSSAATRRSARRTSSGRSRTATRRRSRSTSC